MSEHNPLALKEEISTILRILLNCRILTRMSWVAARDNLQNDFEEAYRRVFIFERGSQMDILSKHPELMGFTNPGALAEMHGLVMRECPSVKRRYEIC